MSVMNTDAEWEKWGKNDPYFGVITTEKFRKKNLTEKAKMEFFESGTNHVDHILEVCRRHLDRDFFPKKILDFGCGTGRLVIPFAKQSEHVVGLDVSDSMLKEAGKNCKHYAVKNVNLLKSDDSLSSLEGCFDLIHSFIVFQHIPTVRGRRIFSKILSHLNSGGICAMQFTYSKAIFEKSYGMPVAESHVKICYTNLKRRFRSLLFRQTSCQDPEMQMNPYTVNELFFIMQSEGIEDVHVEFTNHDGEFGVFLYFQKPKDA